MRFVGYPSIAEPYIWKSELPSGVLLVPVLPNPRRSFNAATLWRWPPAARGHRRLYGEYIAYRRERGAATASCKRDLLVDVGANDGMHAGFFAAAEWDCVAFEPQDSCVNYMKRMASLNSFNNFVIEPYAVGAREATDVAFFVSDSTWYSSLDRDTVERFEPAHAVRVPMVTLDAYCRTGNLVPSCVKIDVEAAELHVMHGARWLIESTKPEIVIEISADEVTRRGIWDQLIPLGYRGYVLSDTGAATLNPLPELSALMAIRPEGHLDAMFTADEGLRARLDARLLGS
jgi:FkbM family methyltransferase